MAIVSHVSAGNSPGPVPSVKLAAEVITREEEARLIETIERYNPQSYPGDAMGGLRAVSYGWRYDMGSETFSPCEAIPDDFDLIHDVAARFAGLRHEEFVQILLNRYAPGAAIPWHCDKSIWEDIVGLSLGTTSTMQFRMPVEGGYSYSEALLAPRSMYLLTGGIRHLCDHGIPPVEETRWSITLRTFSKEGRKLSQAFAASQ